MSELPPDPAVKIDGSEIRLMFLYDDGDMAMVTVTGFRKGFTAMKALAQAADDDVLGELFEQFSEVGDASMLELFDAELPEDGNE